MMTKLTQDLKQWRKTLRLSQAQAATALGVSRMGWVKRENGDVKVPFEAYLAMAYLRDHPEALEILLNDDPNAIAALFAD